MRIVHENPWFTVHDRDGYFTIEYPVQHVIILPVVEETGIVLVRVKRPVINDCTYELPAGGSFEGETPEQAAARELKEETGISIVGLERFERMHPLFNSPNRNPQPIEILKISLTRPEYENRSHHDDEVTEVRLLSFDQVRAMIVSGEMYVSAAIAVTARYLLSLNP